MDLRPCLYREARAPDGGGPTELVCLAGGRHPLGVVGGDLCYLMKVCGTCPIPAALSEEAKPCLYLLPLRIFGEEEIDTLYHCRWLYRLNPRRADRHLSLHFPKACEWWFPHPVEFLPPGTVWHTLRAHRLYLGEIAEPAPPPWHWGPRPLPEWQPRWRRFLKWLSEMFPLAPLKRS